MTFARRCILLLTIGFCLIPALAAAQLAAELESIVRRSALGSTGVAGIAVVDLNTGTTIFSHLADRPLAPASNMKLLTSAAAVKILGPDFAFRTELRMTTDGRIVVVGSGDPALADPEVLGDRDPPESADEFLDSFADAVKAKRINEIIIDDRIFDRELIHPDWPKDQLERWYCAPVQGVNVHANVIAFYPSPGDADTGPGAGMDPVAPWVELENRAKKISKGRNAVWVQRTESDNRFILRGSIRVPSQTPIEVSLHKPALFLGNLLADRLARSGVLVGDLPSPFKAVRLAAPNESFEFTETPLAVNFTDLPEILHRVNYDSYNLYAECLLKRMGYEVTGEQGSWTNGSSVVRMLIAEKLGPEHAASTIIRDGSGLSRENRIRASTIAQWLRAMYHDDETRPALLNSLPTAKSKLAQRFRFSTLNNDLYAKTGTINRVRCLSGYIINHETGQGAAFSVLVNGLASGDAVANSKRLHREIVEAIDQNLGQFAMPAAQPALGG